MPENTAASQTVSQPRPESESLADRERGRPVFRWLIHLGVPLSASLLLHAAVFTVLALRSWQVLGGGGLNVDEYEVELAQVAAEASQELQWPGRQLIDLDQAAAASAVDPFEFRAFTDRATLDELATQSPPANIGAPGEGGFGLGESGRSGVLGIGEGAGAGGGGGGGPGFGVGADIGRAAVWSVDARGSRFAYVVDFSGSIIVAVDELKRELKRSIGTLTSKQSFAVFVFYGGGAQRSRTEAFAPRMQPATPDAKRKFFAWLDRKSPGGISDPMMAMKRALALDPDALFLFSDGMFDESEKVITEIARANRGVGAQIHCLVFDELLLMDTSELPTLNVGARRLKRIAEQSGGMMKVVTGADLDW